MRLTAAGAQAGVRALEQDATEQARLLGFHITHVPEGIAEQVPPDSGLIHEWMNEMIVVLCSNVYPPRNILLRIAGHQGAGTVRGVLTIVLYHAHGSELG